MQVTTLKSLILFFFLFSSQHVYAAYGDLLDIIWNYSDHEYCRLKGLDAVDHMPKGNEYSDKTRERTRYWVRHDKFQDIYFDCRLDKELGY